MRYSEFWPHYLRQHADPATRRLHHVGTGLATAAAIAAIAGRRWWLLPAAIVAGYGPAWIGHFAFERNRPATFRDPLWSFVSDYRMACLWLVGGLDRELAKAGVARRQRTSAGSRNARDAQAKQT